MKNRKREGGSVSDKVVSDNEGSTQLSDGGTRKRGVRKDLAMAANGDAGMNGGLIAKEMAMGILTTGVEKENGNKKSKSSSKTNRSKEKGGDGGGKKGGQNNAAAIATKTSKLEKSGPSVHVPITEWRGYMFMALLSVQYGLQPILCKHFTDKQVITTSMVLSCEIVKIICAIGVVLFQGKWRELTRQWTLRDSLTCSALPAAIYALQNYLVQISYQNLDFLSFTMLNQTKLLFTAFFMFMLLRHKQSVPQMGALMLMVVAAVMLTVGQASPSALSLAGIKNLVGGIMSSSSSLFSKSFMDSKSLYNGVIPVLSASVLSGLASTLCQLAMQNKGRNTYLMTMEMSFVGSFVLLSSMLQSPDGERIRRQGFFYAWERSTMIPVISNAFGGILVGVVTKYVGGVKKGFAIVSALIVTGIGQVVIDGHLPSPYVWASLPLVVGSTLIHTRYPYVKQVKSNK